MVSGLSLRPDTPTEIPSLLETVARIVKAFGGKIAEAPPSKLFSEEVFYEGGTVHFISFVFLFIFNYFSQRRRWRGRVIHSAKLFLARPFSSAHGQVPPSPRPWHTLLTLFLAYLLLPFRAFLLCSTLSFSPLHVYFRIATWTLRISYSKRVSLSRAKSLASPFDSLLSTLRTISAFYSSMTV